MKASRSAARHSCACSSASASTRWRNSLKASCDMTCALIILRRALSVATRCSYHMLETFRLPFNFDAALLQADLSTLSADDWVPHFNTRYYEGAWSAAALRSMGGRTGQIYPDPAAREPFADTPLLARCPHVRAVLQSFACPLQSVRFLRLAAGSVIREHRDLNLGYEDGELRLHIPVRTNAQVEFYLNGRR